MLRDIFSYKEKINSLSLRGPDALQILVLNPGPVSAAVQGQHGRGAPRIPVVPEGDRPHAARSAAWSL